MAEPARADPRYRAFLSYSHKDAGAAARLHKALESYRLPKRLAGRAAEYGPVPQRLLPIFRDRDELPASSDLSARVRAALAQSQALVVLCSPDAAASRWVASEIETFRALHPERPVLAAIVAGEPPDCFPAPLRLADPDGAAREPLATDLRHEGDGPRLALLKLVAGLTGVGLDELVQRDASRRVRRVTAVTGVALAAMLIMALLTVVALGARREADRQRAEAEGLIEFMLTDLRDRLKGVGRTDVLTAVNERALRHYGRQEDLAQLQADSLLRRSRILHAMGEDDLNRDGRDRAALAAFREAHRTTSELLSREPTALPRVYAHAQSEFWLGSVDYGRRDYSSARRRFEQYKLLADRLVGADPRNPSWLKEAGYAEGNLCTVALAERRDPVAAVRTCAAALRRIEQVGHLAGRSNGIVVDLVNRHAWLAEAWNLHGRGDRVLHHRLRQEELALSLRRRDPRNADFQDIWMRTEFTLGELFRSRGEIARARARYREAAATATILHRHDPDNRSWQEWERRVAISQRSVQH